MPSPTNNDDFVAGRYFSAKAPPPGVRVTKHHKKNALLVSPEFLKINHGTFADLDSEVFKTHLIKSLSVKFAHSEVFQDTPLSVKFAHSSPHSIKREREIRRRQAKEPYLEGE